MSISITYQKLKTWTIMLTSGKLIDEDIEEFVEILTQHKPNVIELKYGTCGPKGAIIIADFLTDPNCCVTSLDLSKTRNIGIDGLNRIADAIAKNTSLVEFNFAIYNNYVGFDEFTRRLAKSIKFHPRLKYLNLAHNNSVYISDVIRCLPKSLTELYLFGCSLNIDDFECLSKNTHLKCLIVWLSDDTLNKICRNKHKTILINKMLIEFDYAMYRPSNNNIKINAMLTQNRNARDAAIKAALCFIAIRVLRRNECCLLGRIDINNVLAIAKYVVESYGDDAWRIIEKPSVKRSRRSKK